MRIIRVVMADGGPTQLAAEIFFHPIDEAARVVAKVEILPIFRPDDEAKLALFAIDRRGELFALDVAGRIEHSALRSIALDAIPFDIGEVRARRLGAAARERDVGRAGPAQAARRTAPRASRSQWKRVTEQAGGRR